MLGYTNAVFSVSTFFFNPLLESTISIASSIRAFLINIVALVSGLISLSKIKLMPVARDSASNTTLILASRSSKLTGLSKAGLSLGGASAACGVSESICACKASALACCGFSNNTSRINFCAASICLLPISALAFSSLSRCEVSLIICNLPFAATALSGATLKIRS